MTIDRFRRLAVLHGARIERWPVGERGAAFALAERSEQARAALDEARALDLCLAAATPDVPDAQVERVLAAIERGVEETVAASVWTGVAGVPPRRLWPATAGFLVAMGVCGFLLGHLDVVSLAPRTTATTASSGFTTLVASASDSLPWIQ